MTAASDGRNTRPSPPVEFYLGESEGTPPHWGGEPRLARVVGRATLASGAPAWLVGIDPPIARRGAPPLREAIVMARYPGHPLEAIRDGWIVVNVLRPIDGIDIHQSTFQTGELVIEAWADAAVSLRDLPQAIDEAVAWQQTLARIRRFIDEHGDSAVPPGYADAEGRLDVLIGNLRWHHAGRGGVSPGPFPGIDYAADLDQLPGWEW